MNEGSRQIYVVATVSIVALALLNCIALYYLSSRVVQPIAVGDSGTLANVISVSGTGTAYASPDMAYVSIAAVTQGSTATEAQAKNTDIMRNVIESMKKIGVAEADMQTEQYSLRPIYNYEKDAKIVAYECRNSLRVTWKRINEVGVVLDAAVKAGANNVGTVTFTLSQQKLDTLKTDAIRNAVADADTRAQAIASALGVRITSKMSASLGTPYASTQRVELKADTSTPQIIPGDLQVSMTVNVIYRFA